MEVYFNLKIKFLLQFYRRHSLSSPRILFNLMLAQNAFNSTAERTAVMMFST
jgi:hypothetical protein